MAAICWQCIEDSHLKKKVRDYGKPQLCSICKKKTKKAFNAENLAEILDPILREHYREGEEVKRFGADDDEWWAQEGESLSDILQEVLGQYLGWEEEVIDALVDSESIDWSDGEIGFYDNQKNYVSTPVGSYLLQVNWEDVCEDVKHRRRYFNSSASALFEDIFDDVETRKWWNSKDKQSEKVSYELPEGTEIFRARIFDSNESINAAYLEPLKNVGPPPSSKARAGRMNAEGVVVFYGTFDAETCLAETRPALGSDVVVIKVRTSKTLHVLDFSRLEESYGSLSYFQPDFTEQVEKGNFLRRLQRLISQPIVPGRESEYIITQTMAEYLASVHITHFQGVIFNSVQKSDGVNIVLFPETDGQFPVTYVDDSIDLYLTKAITFTHVKKYVRLEGGKVWISPEFDDE